MIGSYSVTYPHDGSANISSFLEGLLHVDLTDRVASWVPAGPERYIYTNMIKYDQIWVDMNIPVVQSSKGHLGSRIFKHELHVAILLQTGTTKR